MALLPAMPRIVLAAVVFEPNRAGSGIFEDQNAAIAEREFFGLPGGAYSFAKAWAHKLVEPVGFRLGWGFFAWGGIPLTSLFLLPYCEAWQSSLPPSCCVFRMSSRARNGFSVAGPFSCEAII
jgi:hypothetical protein